MKSTHIILRTLRTTAQDHFLGSSPLFQPGNFGVTPPKLFVQTEKMDSRDIASANQSSDVVAVAPAIPIKLIQPLNTPGDLPASPAGVTWGVKAVGADTSPFTGDGVVVAILDTGIDPLHPAFSGVNLIRHNFTSESDDDLHGHGTHCAGTIFGRNFGYTRIGVAPGVKTALIGKVLGASGGSSADIALAIQWALQNGANVISMSLGIDFTGYVKALHDSGQPLELAVSKALEGYRANVQLFAKLASLANAQTAFGVSCVITAAAGNESRRDLSADFKIAASPPSVAEGIISVAALASGPTGLTVAPFSNTGATVSGPGVDVVSARLGGGLISYSGTSMATPHVAGVAALWAEKIKKTGPLTPSELTARLVGTASTGPLQSGFDPADVGTGLVKAPQS